MSEDPYETAARPHETRDVHRPGVAATAACVAALVVLGLAVSGWLWRGRLAARRDRPAESFRHGPAEVPEVVREWPEIERETHERLETYGWVDRKAGIVRIPIERAMARLAQEGRRP